MARIQRLLDHDDRQTFEKLTQDAGKSKSADVRKLIRRAVLRAAADRMADDYRYDPALTFLSTLDEADFLNNSEPG